MKKIRLGEIKTVVNEKRKFGSNVNYYATYIKFKGDTCAVLFTLDELKVAINRSRLNPEDLPKLKRNWFQMFLDWFK